ncbi:DUF4331 domain-containing protein [Streptomyces anulatus]|uniref:DUF4331 domain-containing protein n=1 Tax=Streptomyces anulatus TaxID=1892 RepID=UPI00224DB406|nr:DUF4331 domain-containing protein [Streptomyces anulatus]MCX4522812.1 DUF4331 domain-containing protein [Streptomyces anulatus]MCX4605823.1 DUF4331 domain-containing protein [Streptomyces anulatus]
MPGTPRTSAISSPARPRLALLAATTAALTAAALSGQFMGVGRAGGHIDAPSTVLDSPADLTDVYAFTSPDDADMVTLIANVRPFQVPGTAANALVDFPFATGARYEIHTDADGDGAADTTYRWTFRDEDRRPFGVGPKVGPLPVNSLDDRSLGVRQKYTLEKVDSSGAGRTLLKDAIASPTHTGRTLMPDYGKLRNQATRQLPGGGRTVATQAAEAFKADTQVFGLYTVGTSGPVPGWLPDAQPLSALNVNSLILQVPKKDIALKGDPERNPVVGVWASVSRQGANLERSLSKQAPTFRQVSRQGTPHIAFALFGSTVGLAQPGGPEDRFQARLPKDDHLESDFLAATLDPVPPHRIERAQGRTAPATPRRDIQALFMKGIGKDNGSTFGFDLNTHTMNADANPERIVLAEQLRLNLSTPVTTAPKSHGVIDGDLQGFPNGRRLNDNIDGPLIRMLEGEPAGPSAADLLPRPVLSLQPADAQTTFPYLNLPHAGP